MLTFREKQITEDARSMGWVLEPAAKELLAGRNLTIPGGVVTDSVETAVDFMNSAGSQVVLKAVSPLIVHKTEHQAVVTGIDDPDILASQMKRLLTLEGCDQVLVEEMVSGIEILVGAKNDVQFGPVVVLGLGGTSVELFADTAIRLAPVTAADVRSMVDSLAAGPIFKGFRGRAGVDMDALTRLMVSFSHLIMALESQVESIDLNPVICPPDRCVAVDARIMLLPDWVAGKGLIITGDFNTAQ